MVRIGLDSNLLVYAELEPESDKGRRASAVIGDATRNAVIAAQVFGEFLSVVRRKKPDALTLAILQVEKYRRVVKAPPTTPDAVMTAIEISRDRNMQFWDALICVVAGQAGATVLFSEDMQDGADIRGLKIVNPFDPKNEARIDQILKG
jgi:predicted nucleic acid-binding protein